MKKGLLVLMILVGILGGIVVAAEAGTVVDDGRMIIYFRGTEVGYEHYTLTRQDKDHLVMNTDSEFVLPRGAGDIFFRYQTQENMDGEFNPEIYQETFWINKRESDLRVTFKNGQAEDSAFMGGQTLSRTAKVHSSFRLLEEAVYSLYYPLMLKYRLKKDNNQTIWVYVPKIASELKATIKYNGDTTLKTPLGEMKLQRYFVDVGGFQGVSLAVNAKDQIIEMVIPRQEITLRRDLAYDLKQANPTGEQGR